MKSVNHWRTIPVHNPIMFSWRNCYFVVDIRLWYPSVLSLPKLPITSRIILCIRSANKRRRYDITSSLIGWTHAQKNACYFLCRWITPLFLTTVFHHCVLELNLKRVNKQGQVPLKIYRYILDVFVLLLNCWIKSFGKLHNLNSLLIKIWFEFISTSENLTKSSVLKNISKYHPTAQCTNWNSNKSNMNVLRWHVDINLCMVNDFSVDYFIYHAINLRWYFGFHWHMSFQK